MAEEQGVLDQLRHRLFDPELCPYCGEVVSAGVPWPWLVFGIGAQALFMSRMLVQWLASERLKRSVVSTSFWLLSLLGGRCLLTYFLRRGDPVGVAGQGFGVFVYLRNLSLIWHARES